MKKIIVANNVLLTGHRPWQREDDNFFEAALERFQFICNEASKQKAALVLTGSVFGRLTNPQIIQVMKELPKQTFVIADKMSPILSAMDKAGFIKAVTADEPFIDAGGIQLAVGDENLIDESLKKDNTVLFTHAPHTQPLVGAVLLMNNVNSVEMNEFSIPNAIRLFPGQEHQAGILRFTLNTDNKLAMQSIVMPYGDENYLSKVTEKTEQIANSLAMSKEGATSNFASLLKEHSEKLATGEIADTHDFVEETKGDDQHLEDYIEQLYVDAVAAVNTP